MKRVFKYSLFILLAALATATLVNMAGVPLWQKTYNGTNASVAASTTKNYTYPTLLDLRGRPTLSLQMETVQVSGTSGGTAYVEVSNDVATSPLWSTYASWTWTGSADDTLIVISAFPYHRVRARFVTNGTTQATTQYANFNLSSSER